MPIPDRFTVTFGCDYLSGTYKVVVLKVVALSEGLRKSKVRVFSLGDNCWRNILSFPMVPLGWVGVHLSRTVNWLAIGGGDFILCQSREIWKFPNSPVQRILIVSLDLSTETYKQFLLPPSFNEVPCVAPSLRVMMDCLCFSHDFKRTKFVVWQMKEFGVQESWTQLFRIEYVDLQIHNLSIYDIWGYMRCDTPLLPLYISKNRDTLILKNDKDDGVVGIRE